MRSRLVAEFLGTFFLVFAGTGAVVVNAQTDGAVTHVGVALTFGLVVMSMIFALGDVSGAHLNPAVSVGFWVAGRMPARELVLYAVAQVGGALAASGVLRGLFPASPTLGETLPSGALGQSLVLEAFLTMMLMLVILAVSSASREKGLLAGIAIGGVVGLEALFAGPISGASMNPARSLGPALVGGQSMHLWVYLLGPTTGAIAAVMAFRLVRPSGTAEAR